MGVYIPNWKKPKSCDECWAEYAYEICNSHSKCCPLVPVPEHGDLIDRDKIAYFKDDSNLVDFDYAYRSQINSMPTIIPAEEGET